MITHIKRVILLSLSLTIAGIFATSAQVRQTRQEYINRYKHIAVAHMERYGIPASITMAQGILESDSGNSTLAKKSNNHFGIKCKSSWEGDKVYHDDDAKDECFRAYPSVEKSYQDHADFLDNSPRYDALFNLPTSDYKGWARGLKKAGYATAPDYAQKLIKIIEDNDLQVLDKKGGLDKYANLHGGSAIPVAEAWFADSPDGAPSIITAAAIADGVDPNNFAATINAHKGYNVYRNNGVFYIMAKSGDTFETIAEFFKVTSKRLRSYNDLPRRAQLNVGDVIYIARKQSRWMIEDTPTTHIVKQGETIQTVSQEYAITVSALRRINKLEVKYAITPGQTIKLK